MKKNDEGVRLCVCGKQHEDEKSFFTKFEVVLGAIIVFAVVPIFLAIAKSLFVLPYALLALLGVWIFFSTIRLLKGHSIECSARRGFVVVMGSLGGFWFAGF